MKPIVQCQGLSKNVLGHNLLSDLTLTISPGQFLMLLGNNPIEKSMFLRLLSRLERPSAGHAAVMGHSIDKDSRRFQQGIGYLTDGLKIDLNLSIDFFFAQYAKLYPHWDWDACHSFMDKFKVPGKKLMAKATNTERIELALIGLLARKPKLLLLEDVTVQMELPKREFFLHQLKELTQVGSSIILSTNRITELEQYCSHILLLHHGKVDLDVPIAQVAQSFRRLRRFPGDQSNVFNDPDCQKIYTNSDGTESYIFPASKLSQYPEVEKLIDKRNVRVAEALSSYLKRL